LQLWHSPVPHGSALYFVGNIVVAIGQEQTLPAQVRDSSRCAAHRNSRLTIYSPYEETSICLGLSQALQGCIIWIKCWILNPRRLGPVEYWIIALPRQWRANY